MSAIDIFWIYLYEIISFRVINIAYTNNKESEHRMTAERERRRENRFEHGNLSVKVQRAGVLGKLQKKRVVDWMDYNRKGMAFETERKFGLSTRLLVDLAIDDVKSVVIKSVKANVRNISDCPGGRYLYGVQFDDAKANLQKSRNLQQSLTDIEILLNDIFKRLEGTTD